MKQLYIQTATQHPKSIEDEFSVKNQSNIGRNSNRLAILNPKQPGGAFGTDKHEWKGTGLCKGPPGRPRSPGLFPEHPPARLSWSDGPDGGATPYRVPNPVGGNTPRNAEIQTFKSNKFNYYSQSNFTIMKKQILFLAMFLLAVFAGINKSFGQAQPGSIPFIPATPCMQDDALHPIAGKAYDYTAVVNPTGGNFLWWATKNTAFVTSQTVDNSATKLDVGTGKDILAASANYGVAGGMTNSSTVNITWSSALLSNTGYQNAGGKTATFVVVKYDAPAAGCADNLKVWELDPRNGFTVDIRNIEDVTKVPLGYNVSDTQCIDKVSKATYSGGTVAYEYGTNVLYYELIAANFSEEWKPQITVTKADAVQTYVLEWTYDKTLASGWQTYVDGTTVFTTDQTNTANGVSVYLRMTVTNNNFENNATAHPTGSDIILALDGQNKEGLWDIKNVDCTDPKAADKDDTATQTLLPRPEVKEGTVSGQATNQTMVPGNEVP